MEILISLSESLGLVAVILTWALAGLFYLICVISMYRYISSRRGRYESSFEIAVVTLISLLWPVAIFLKKVVVPIIGWISKRL